MTRVTQRFWPPQFFNGQRGCGCCQPPPPPPPPPANLYYYYGGTQRQVSPCQGFCDRDVGPDFSQTPGVPRLWLLEVDGFFSVTSAESPCELSTATICENANGSFVLDYYDSYADGIDIPVQNKEDWWPYDSQGYHASTFVCRWRSPQFVGIDKIGLFPIPGTDPPSCATCRTTFCYYEMNLTGNSIRTKTLGTLVERTYLADLRLIAIGDALQTRIMARWDSPIDPDTLSQELQDVMFDCNSENIFDLTFADWGYGSHNEFMLDGFLCCSGAPNNVSLQPL